MKVKIHNLTNFKIDYYRQIITTVFKQINDNHQMQLIFVDDDEIKRLNTDYRQRNTVTDVLSFIDDSNESLGDVFIAVPQMLKQAQEYQHSIKRELVFLAVHGYLHLKGYDHEESDDAEKEMFALQEKILKAVKIIK
jgi:probable rRNA maturation factor